jgi:hypothetical protein
MAGNGRQRERDLPAVELLPNPDSESDAEACSNAVSTGPRRAELTRAPSHARQGRGRLLRVVAIAVAATVLGAAVTHRYDQWTRPATPPWIQACRAAIDATAQLQRRHGIEVDEAMQSTWALAAGLYVQPQPIDTSSIARFQRDADNKTRDCVTPTDPAHSR